MNKRKGLSVQKKADAEREQELAEFVFFVEPGPGQAPFQIDLTPFAFGSDYSARRYRSQGPGYFQGRRSLATGLKLYFQLENPLRRRAIFAMSAFRQLFRFLERIDPAGKVQGVADLTDGHGALLLTWLLAPETDQSPRFDRKGYNILKSVIGILRTCQHLPPLFWPTAPRPNLTISADIDENGIRSLFQAFQHEAKQIIQMFEEGESLSSQGCDPRGQPGRKDNDPWAAAANQAWLVKRVTREGLPNRRELYEVGARDLDGEGAEPDYVAPLLPKAGTRRYRGKLRWFYPCRQDTAVLFWMFLIRSGWNLSTAFALDISEESNWAEPHPQKPNVMVLSSFKARADKHQLTFSSKSGLWDPYQIVLFMLRHTGALRATLASKLKMLVETGANDPRTRAEIVGLENAIKSPWLFHISDRTRPVSCLGQKDSTFLNRVLRSVVERHQLAEVHPALKAYTTSHMRDAWIGHAYAQSGYSMLIARLAGQHSNLSTLRHYLRRRRYRTHSERQIRCFQVAAYEEIAARRPLDATRIRVLLEKGAITHEQWERLSDVRQRTRLGMGCLDPYHPPREIALGHQPGQICRVQRCVGCQHGLVFQDSLDPLARAYAELIFVKSQIPFASWNGSSLETEEQNLTQVLRMFHEEEVKEAVRSWSRRLKNSETMAHDVFPSY